MAKTIDELSQTEISELINRRASVFSPEDSASKVKGELEKTGRYEAIVVGGGKVGSVTLRDLLDVDLLEQTKVDRLWKSQWQTPVTSDSWVGSVATEMVRINARAFPVVEDMRPVGIISQVDIVAAMADCQELKKIPAKDLAIMPLVTLGAYAKIAEARKLMLDKGISHIPIVKDEKLVGIVTAQDIVQFFSTGIGRMKTGERQGPKAGKYPGEVEDLMDKQPLTFGSDATALDVARGLRDQEESAALMVNDNGSVYGIITPKELLELIAEPEMEPELPISIVGFTNEEFLEKSLAEEKLKKAVNLGMKIHPDINNVQVVIKKADKGGEKGRYEMTVRVLTPKEQFQTSNEGYDLVKTFDGLVSALEKVFKQAKHEQSKVPRRGRGRP